MKEVKETLDKLVQDLKNCEMNNQIDKERLLESLCSVDDIREILNI